MTEITKSKIRSTDEIGKWLFIGSLIFYCIVKLPFNFSVQCGSNNEGYFFVYGGMLLNGYPIFFMPLFVALYALVIKMFGFGTYAVITVHFLQNLIVIFNAVLIYLILKKLLENNFFSGLGVLFWIVIQLTPIGGWGRRLELESTFALEAESLCVLFSLLSIYLLTLHRNDMSLLAGFLSMCSVMFKSTGSIIFLAVVCWLIYLILFERKQIKSLMPGFIYFFIGFLLSFLLFNAIVYFITHDLFNFWNYQFSAGSYSRGFLKKSSGFILFILKFMTRGTNSCSNFIMFFFTFVFLLWGLSRRFFIREEINILRLFLPLLSIWGIGNICAVIAPGEYGSYYYILVWPTVAIFLTIGLRDLFTYVGFLNTNACKAIVVVLITVFFLFRFSFILPKYYALSLENIQLSAFSQEASFQDPVKDIASNKYNITRREVFKAADLINKLLPNKNDTFFIFNFTKGHQDFSPTFQVYAKRLPPSVVFSDHLHYSSHLDLRIKTLITELKKSPPKILILPEDLQMKEWQKEKLSSFFGWLRDFINDRYYFKTGFSYSHLGLDSIEKYVVFERNN